MRGTTILSITCGCIIGLLGTYVIVPSYIETTGTVRGSPPKDATSIVTLRGIVESVDLTAREITILVAYPGFPEARAPFRISFEAVNNYANVSIPKGADNRKDASNPRYDISKTQKGQLALIRLQRDPGPFRILSLVVNKPLPENL